MSFSSSSSLIFLASFVFSVILSYAQLSPSFYSKTCPNVFTITGRIVAESLLTDPRIGASIIRLHFHDCFVNGCDASILLDNSPTIKSEKDAGPNANSARGFEVIDRIKAEVEKACPRTVSCADILTIAAQESVVLSGGPAWMGPVGRRDSLRAFLDLANTDLPGPSLTLDQLKASFAKQGLTRPSELVALSGAHTFGRARCLFILDRLYNFQNTGSPDATLNQAYLSQLRRLCPQNGDSNRLVTFDPETPDRFDSKYFSNLQQGKGLLQSDQELFSTPGADTTRIVDLFSRNTTSFFESFVRSMIKMGNIKPLTGSKGEIRLNCRVVNSARKLDDNVIDGVVSESIVEHLLSSF